MKLISQSQLDSTLEQFIKRVLDEYFTTATEDIIIQTKEHITKQIQNSVIECFDRRLENIIRSVKEEVSLNSFTPEMYKLTGMDHEYETLERLREFLYDFVHVGRYVVIREDDYGGDWESFEKAIEMGKMKYGHTAKFFIHEIEPKSNSIWDGHRG